MIKDYASTWNHCRVFTESGFAVPGCVDGGRLKDELVKHKVLWHKSGDELSKWSLDRFKVKQITKNIKSRLFIILLQSSHDKTKRSSGSI